MHVARPYKGVFRDRIMCRSLASADNSAVVSSGHEHQLTCHTGARIRASEPRSVERDIRPRFQWLPKPTFFCASRIALGFDTCCFLILSLSLEQLAAFIAQRFREIVCHEFGGDRPILTRSRHLDLRTRNGNDRSR